MYETSESSSLPLGFDIGKKKVAFFFPFCSNNISVNIVVSRLIVTLLWVAVGTAFSRSYLG